MPGSWFRRPLFSLGIYLFAFTLSSSTIAADSAPSQAELFQYSTLDALSEGVFEGELKVSTLKSKGSFGLGTFNGLDGEMLMLGGLVYQIHSDGKVSMAGDEQELPFAAVVSAPAETSWQTLAGPKDLAGLEAALDSLAASKNDFYAFRIEGQFDSVDMRSVPAQKKPYPNLSTALKKQVFMSAKTIQGSLVGLRCPAWAKGINVVGYHFHFISADRQFGGHVLGCHLAQGKLSLLRLASIQLQVPGNEAFSLAKLPLASMPEASLQTSSKAPAGH
jgi:acetolactate decarboxylase